MDLSRYEDIAPFVRMVKIKKSVSLSKTWEDIDHVLIYIAHGHGDYFIKGQRYSMKTGDLIIMPPYFSHFLMTRDEKMLTQYVVHFDLFMDKERELIPHQTAYGKKNEIYLPEKENLMHGEIFYTTVPQKERYVIENLFLNMYREFTKKTCGSEVMLRGMMMQLLITSLRMRRKGHSLKASQNTVGHKSWKLIEQALEYIYLHFNEDNLDNAKISEAVKVSPNYLSKIFREYLGISLHKYLISYRIERAQYYIMNNNCNITEAASMSGFSSIHAFSKSFKQLKGISPSAYMETLLKVDEPGGEDEYSTEGNDYEDYNTETHIYFNQ
ncbi:AraC family transcriptional regulator [Blautia schinkii]|nr:AraC family transcriptional regulator [Blautia schinkii]